MRMLIVSSISILASCTAAEFNSINRQFNPTMADSRLIDAKQRAIVAVAKPHYNYNEDGTIRSEVRDPVSGEVITSPVVCAEPSPDALQATATTLAGSGQSESAAAAISLAFSNSDSAASIGLRTQAIQLLRDSYYRICEGYAGGSLDGIGFEVLQKRFQNHMIALLAVEQLTGVVKASSAAISSTAAANAGANLAVIQAQLDALASEKSGLTAERTSLATEKKSLSGLTGDDATGAAVRIGEIDGRLGTIDARIDAIGKEEEFLRKTLAELAKSGPSTLASGRSLVNPITS